MRDLGERCFVVLLFLYPRSFRARFGDEMLAFYRARRAEARHRHGIIGAMPGDAAEQILERTAPTVESIIKLL